MKSKKGMEFAMSTVAIIILSIIILSLGIGFVFRVWRGSEEIVGRMDKATKERIETALYGGERVFIYPKVLTVKKGKLGSVGVGVRNEENTQTTFKIIANQSAGPSSGRIEAMMVSNELELEPGQVRTILLGLNTESADPGDYIINICICDPKRSSSSSCGSFTECDPANSGYDESLLYEPLQKVVVKVTT